MTHTSEFIGTGYVEVLCLSCGEPDAAPDYESIRPTGDWKCPNCGWLTARPTDMEVNR